MERRKSLSHFILLALEKSVDGYVRAIDFTYNSWAYTYRDRGRFPLKKTALSQALKRLREKGFIEYVPDSELAYRLTDEGRDRAMLAKLALEGGEWDGKWRLVLFDVPEKRRAARDLLRNKLKQWGFKPWQQSVWVTKKSCTKELRTFIKSIGIEDWVMVVESDNTGR